MNLFWLVLGVIAGMLLAGLGASGVLRWQPRHKRRGPYRKLISAALAHLASGDRSAAVKTLKEASRFQSGDDAWYLLLGEQLRQEGDFSRAERICDVLLAKRDLDPLLRSATWLLRGKLWERAGAFDQALTAYQSAAESNPHGVPPLVALGRLYSQRKRWPEAIDAAERLAKLDRPRSRLIAARRRILLSRELIADGQARPALKQAQKAVGEVPDLASGHLTVGDAKFQLGQTAQAREAWMEAARLAPWLAPAVLDRLEPLSGATGDREIARKFATAQAERGLGEETGWRVLVWLTDEALRRDALDQARRWCDQLGEAAPWSSTMARLRVRLAAAEDRSRAGSSLMALIHRWEGESLWIDPWRCRNCGHTAAQMEWRCSRCQAWESFR